MRKQRSITILPPRARGSGNRNPKPRPLDNKSAAAGMQAFRNTLQDRRFLPSDFDREIGAPPAIQILDDRIERGLVIVRREKLKDGKERITYKNMMP